ncbi:MAG: FAD-dependent oxidoreductase [Candidatus Binataceae bacterium]
MDNDGTYRSGAELRVLIVGGGIAGLTLGALLRQRGCRPVIVEWSHHYDRAGYVLGLLPVGGRILEGLGLYQRFEAVGVPLDCYNVADGGGRVLKSYNFESFSRVYGSMLLVHRADLLRLLREGLDDVAVRMGVTVERIDQRGDSVAATFSDSTSEEFDLVAGADGLRSRVRELIFGKVPLHYCGFTGWGFWIKPEFTMPHAITEYWAPGRFFGIYPTKDALACFIAESAPAGREDPVERRIERIRRDFGHLGGIVPRILAALDRPAEMFHDDFCDLRMESWSRNRVVLAGDSAHAILPTGGVGASMAMESAAVLADELSRADSRDLPLALERYERRRRKRVDRIQSQSRLLGRLALVNSSALSALRNQLIKLYSANAAVKYWRRILTELI